MKTEKEELLKTAECFDRVVRKTEEVNAIPCKVKLGIVFTSEWARRNTESYNKTRITVAYKERELARLLRQIALGIS